MGTTEWIVVVLVVGGRLVLPLLIPYFPVPAARRLYEHAEQLTVAPEAGPQPSPGPA